MWSNRYLLAAITGTLGLAAIFVYTSPLQQLLGTAALRPAALLILLPYPFLVWGADELRQYLIRTRTAHATQAVVPSA